VRSYSLSHLPDRDLKSGLAATVARCSADTADLLAHIAEFDSRRLYAGEGYSSMFVYCVEALHFSEEATYKRIRAARAARQFPVIFDMIADGRIHLSGVVVLASCLTPENVGQLLKSATHQTKATIERQAAAICPQPDMPSRIRPLAAPQLSPGTVALPDGNDAASQMPPAPVTLPVTTASDDSPMLVAPELSPGTVAPPSAVAPITTERFAVQFTMDAEMHGDLREAQALLGHIVPAGDLARIFGRALKLLVGELKKTKFGVTNRPRVATGRAGTNPRYIPAAVRRAVHKRDQGRCTFVGDSGRRCLERGALEFDHVEPIARGGGSNVENLRLRCRAHNQFEAERAFGASFMDQKRDRARRPEGREAKAPGHAAAHIRMPRFTPIPEPGGIRWRSMTTTVQAIGAPTPSGAGISSTQGDSGCGSSGS
jgi:5-methylcytosine-specific restriction endonuclease McrA